MNSQVVDSQPASKILLYGHAACPGVPPVKGLLASARVEYEYIDIRQDPEAAQRVRALNAGNESVPTLVFPDGSSLTEPTVGELKAKLEALGYRVGPLAWLIGNGWRIIVGAAVLFSILRFLEIL